MTNHPMYRYGMFLYGPPSWLPELCGGFLGQEWYEFICCVYYLDTNDMPGLGGWYE